MRILVVLSLTLLCCFCKTSVYAGTEKYAIRLDCQQIQNGYSFSLTDPLWPSLFSHNWRNEFTNVEVKNYVRLLINDNDKLAIASSFSIRIGIDIQYEDENLSTHTKYVEIWAEYNPTTGVLETNESLRYFKGAHLINAKINSIQSTYPGGSVPCNVFLELESEIDRVYRFNLHDGMPAGHTYHSHNNTLDIYWSDTLGAEMYELEWLWIDDYAATPGSYTTISALKYDFENNASRLRTGAHKATLPLVYAHGYLVYRVRGVSRSITNPKQLLWGAWNSTASTGYLINYPYRFATGGHHNDKINYNIQLRLSDNGRMSESISYVDGMGKIRQQIVKTHEHPSAIVGETYYDHYGRPALNFLPVPIQADPGDEHNELKYYVLFNRDSTGNSLTPQDYDRDHTPSSGGCKSPGLKMSKDYGASNYYSENNPDKEFQQAFLPNANGYPYSRISYIPDKTGRVKRKTLFGESFKSESGREIVYGYGSASAGKLKNLFGNQSGLASNYYESVTIDPNGQISATYSDMRGNIIMSTLGGDGPLNLLGLDQNTGTSPDTLDLLIRNTSSARFHSIEDSWNSSYNMFSKKQSVNALNYGFVPNKIEDVCLPNNYCLDCEYIVNVSVKDECGNEMIAGGAIIDTLFHRPFDTICQANNYQLSENITMQKAMTYTISKTVSVNPEAIQEAAKMYFEKNKCYKNLTDFVNEEIAGIDFSGCEYAACKYYAISLIGKRDTAANKTLYDSAYTAIMRECQYPDDCSKLYDNILEDLSPGGQYAQYSDSGKINPSLFPLSVFNINNNLPNSPYWRNYVFLDEDGLPDSVLLPNGMLVPPNHDSVSLDFFVSNFQPHWAKNMALAHPEYCYYEWCQGQKASYRHDRDILLTKNFDTANAYGYMAPMGQVDSLPSGVITRYNDPFWNTLTGQYHLNRMRDSMNHFLKLPNGQSYSIWNVAVIDANCPLDSTYQAYDNCLKNYSFGDACYRDLHWRSFRQLYFTLKRRLMDSLITANAMQGNCYNGCIGVSLGSFVPAFNNFNCYPIYKTPTCSSTNYNGYNHFAQPCSASNLHRYSNKVRRYNLLLDTLKNGRIYSQWISSNDTLLDTARFKTCYNYCEGLADQWMARLKGCSFSVADSANARSLLIQICKSGCDSLQLTGSRTTPLGRYVTLGTDTFYSFAQVIDHFAAISDTCNEFLIIRPEVFGDTTIRRSYTMDNCGCDKVLYIKQLWTGGGYPTADIKNMEDLFERTYGYRVYDLVFYACKCQEALDLVYETWSPGHIWHEDSKEFLLSLALPAPIDMLCPRCISCDKLAQYKDSLYINLGADTGKPHYYIMLANYINSRERFDFSALQYAAFDAECKKVSTSAPNCKRITPEAKDLEYLLSQLGPTSFWTETSPSYSIGSYPYNWVSKSYLKSKFPSFGVDGILSCYGFNFNTSNNEYRCNDSTFSVLLGDLASLEFSCAIDIVIPNKSSKIYGFQNLIALHRMSPRNPSCSTTYDFWIQAVFKVGNIFYYDTIKGTSDCIPIANCRCTPKTLCDIDSDYVYVPDTNDCEKRLISLAHQKAWQRYNSYVDSAKAGIYNDMLQRCHKNLPDSEYFNLTYPSQDYVFTLYYYDQANNLVRTVPPAGINATNPNAHSLATDYRYNSYNLITQQKSPDGGLVYYYYDKAGRLLLSQNGDQAVSMNDYRYSYTLYDDNSRIIEVGERNGFQTFTQSDLDSAAAYLAWLNIGTRTQITRTFYDQPLSNTINELFANGQQYLRNRIATVAYYDVLPGHDTLYNSAIHYSYDAHGNVVELINDYPALSNGGQRYKRVSYDYDLISGNVNRVHYQDTLIDAMHHRYSYDSDNRLSEVKTSRDGHIWKRDAKYHYYHHGPLARVELGNKQVQGTDYFYTINGWLKGVNSESLAHQRDAGRDGNDSARFNQSALHHTFARDAFSYMLHYHRSDYIPISAAQLPKAQFPVADTNTGSGFHNYNHGLFNGNISAMTIALTGRPTHGTAYRYDQLNRLVSATTHLSPDSAQNAWQSASPLPDFLSAYRYDANGNITNLLRAGNSAAVAMDSLEYHYTSGTNRLQYITDFHGPTSFPYDLENQAANNYSYNKTGSLTKDIEQGIDSIYWSIYGKPLRIDKPGLRLRYAYNPLGQRIKQETDYLNGQKDITWYSYDAGGNMMAIYEEQRDSAAAQRLFRLTEHPIYGSTRLGTDHNPLLLHHYDSLSALDTLYLSKDSIEFTSGLRIFELSNHLGNVLATLTDRKLHRDFNLNDTADFYCSDTTSFHDYYPYGMEKPGRGSNPTGYRFGFNGVEADNTLMPGRTGYNFGARMYDGRTGRWMSKDPLEVKYPFYSPYHSMANNPMLYVDPDGRKNVIYIHIDKNFAQGKIDIEKLKDNIRKAMFECSPLGMFYGIVFVNEVMEKKYLDPSDVSVSISDLYYLHENFPGVYSQDGAGSTPKRSGFESPAGVSISNIYKYGGSEPYVAWVALHEAIHRITQMSGNEDFVHEEMAIDGKWSPNNMLDGLDYKQEISGKTIDQLIGNGFFDLSTNRMKMITSVIEIGDPVDNATQSKAIETGANRADIGTPMETRYSKTTVTTEGSKTERK